MTLLPQLDPETLLTTSEVAEHVGVDRRTVQRWVKDGRFPNAKTVRSGSIIPWGDVVAYIESKDK